MRYVPYLWFSFLFMALFTFAGVSGAAGYDAPTPRAANAIAANAVNAFAVDIYGALAAESGNIFFSPYSISSALAMTFAGAKGDTAAEMAETLRFTGFEHEIHTAMKSLQDHFNSIPDEMGSLDVANRLWLDKGEKLTPDFEALTREYYDAGVKTVDFFTAHESARVVINDWVAQKTRDKIKDLLEKDNVTSATKLILVNAIYFSSAWLEPFNKADTREDPFYMGKDKQKPVPMMTRTDRFLYGENTEMQWLKIPYSIPGFSMLILLPKENDTFTQLEELEKNLSPDALASWLEEMNFSQVALRMPKFKDERRYLLTDVLQKLGMNLAFTNDADFSGMVDKPVIDGHALHIDYVVHQSFIELDEERTEAAAATAVGMMRTTAIIQPEPVIEFNADRPFIYCLTDDRTGTIIFMGRMEQP